MAFDQVHVATASWESACYSTDTQPAVSKGMRPVSKQSRNSNSQTHADASFIVSIQTFTNGHGPWKFVKADKLTEHLNALHSCKDAQDMALRSAYCLVAVSNVVLTWLSGWKTASTWSPIGRVWKRRLGSSTTMRSGSSSKANAEVPQHLIA